jgi:hypothetical protein
VADASSDARGSLSVFSFYFSLLISHFSYLISHILPCCLLPFYSCLRPWRFPSSLHFFMKIVTAAQQEARHPMSDRAVRSNHQNMSRKPLLHFQNRSGKTKFTSKADWKEGSAVYLIRVTRTRSEPTFLTLIFIPRVFAAL